jgi:hypothetical protein
LAVVELILAVCFQQRRSEGILKTTAGTIDVAWRVDGFLVGGLREGVEAHVKGISNVVCTRELADGTLGQRKRHAWDGAYKGTR